MEKLTPCQLEDFARIPDSEIQKDIDDTQREIDQYEKEQKVLQANPVENKVQLYMLSGKIGKRRDFIDKLNQILEHRKIVNDCYNVARYFDDHFETNIATNLSKEVAEKLANDMNNSKQHAYVKYLVRKVNQDK